jgi:alkanesulfonate monooxygenase SsuD/methylene tetrahydromethanopterin reductase-like flavin-dependent oxidoreductase (luciferase family)
MARPLKIGLQLPHGEGWSDGATPRWSDLRAISEAAEAVGFDSLWIADHMLIRWAAVAEQYGEPVSPALAAEEPNGVWEGWTVLTALAPVTSRVELGTLVMCTGYRNPALLAKMADTLDEISNGRLVLGLGAGDFEDEHRSYGFRWDHRVGRFEEALGIIRGLLRDGRIDHDGEYYQARDCELRPRAAQRAPGPQGPPIMIGALGSGPRMMRLVAEYADIWNGWLAFGDNRPDAVPPLREAIDAACVAAGRDPATLARSAGISVAVLGRDHPQYGPIKGEPEQIAETLVAFAREGISEVEIDLLPNTVAGVEAFAPVLELLDRA